MSERAVPKKLAEEAAASAKVALAAAEMQGAQAREQAAQRAVALLGRYV